MTKAQTEKFNIVDGILMVVGILGVIAWGISLKVGETNEVVGIILAVGGFGVFGAAAIIGIVRSAPTTR